MRCYKVWAGSQYNDFDPDYEFLVRPFRVNGDETAMITSRLSWS